VIGIRWGLSPHASSFNLLTASIKKLQSVLNFGHSVSWQFLEICWKSYMLIC